MEANTNNNRENFLIYTISELNVKETNEPTGMINCIPKIVLFQIQNCTFFGHKRTDYRADYKSRL